MTKEVRLPQSKAYFWAAFDALAAFVCLAFIQPSGQPTSNLLPAGFALVLTYAGIVSYLNGRKGAFVRFEDDQIVAAWAGKSRSFRYDEIVAVVDLSTASDSSTDFMIYAINGRLQLPKILEATYIEGMVRQKMDERGVPYALTRPTSRLEIQFFCAVAIFLMAAMFVFIRYFG